ncbi:MAG TPA: peptide deformylase [Candidatus Merdivicinus intestinavium]|nr:peptide deformylase [Candidatus Merdivicinus intestinavium]
MALRKIVTGEDPVLRKTSRTVENFDEKLGVLLDDMAETMYKAEGVGLAAVQVGILKRVVTIDVGDGLIELVNPVITESSGTQEDSEGCLSFPNEFGIVERPNQVTVKAFDRSGKPVEYHGTGLLARAFCHEIDHLDGVVFKDKVKEMLEPEPPKKRLFVRPKRK